MRTDAPDELTKLDAGQQALLQHALAAQQQLDVILALTRRLLELLTPADLDDGRPRLDDLLAHLIGQQAALLEVSKQTHAGVSRLEARLERPAANNVAPTRQD